MFGTLPPLTTAEPLVASVFRVRLFFVALRGKRFLGANLCFGGCREG